MSLRRERKMISQWIGALTNPRETFRNEKINASIGKGAVNFFIAGLISAIFGFLISMTSASAGLATAVGVMNLVTAPIGNVISGIITIGIIFLFAKVLGGKGSFGSLFYLISLAIVPITVIVALLSGLLLLLPILAIPIILCFLIIFLYAIYIEVIAISISQEIGMGKALLVLILPGIIAFIIAVILILVIGAAFIAALGSAVSTTGMVGLI